MSARLRNLNSGGGKVGTISQLKNRMSTTSLNKTFTLASLILVVVATQSVPSQAQKTAMTPEMVTMFEQKVRPTLEAKCIACHGPKQQSANLRLDKPINARMAYKVAEAISYETDPEMPPSGKLPVDQLAAMTAWAMVSGSFWSSWRASPFMMRLSFIV
jgi:mono/diheme cytochrome c family protein